MALGLCCSIWDARGAGSPADDPDGPGHGHHQCGVMFFSAYDPATGMNVVAGWAAQQLPGTLFVAPLASGYHRAGEHPPDQLVCNRSTPSCSATA